jgi:hypothetical protein
MKKIAFSLIFIATIVSAVALQSKAEAVAPPQLLQEAERQLSLMRSSVYQHHTDVNEATGRFNYDCSGFLDYALQKVSPEAYAEVPISSASSKRPLAEDFYTLFSQRAKKSAHWERIRKVNHVHAGDIVAWLRPIDNDSNNTGHVMIVSAEPSINPQQTDEILIPVIDSTTSPHAQDSRLKGQTGLGSGVIGVLFDRKNEPIAYHWRGAKSKRAEQTPIAFGRIH